MLRILVLAMMMALVPWAVAPSIAQAREPSVVLRVFEASWCSACKQQLRMMKANRLIPKFAVKINGQTIPVTVEVIDVDDGDERVLRTRRTPYIPENHVIVNGRFRAYQLTLSSANDVAGFVGATIVRHAPEILKPKQSPVTTPAAAAAAAAGNQAASGAAAGAR